MVEIGIVTGREIVENKDGEQKSLMLQLELSEEDDIQTVELINLAGEDNNPANESTVVVIKISESYKVGIAANDGIESTVDPGERKIYSYLAGVIKSFAYFKKDGTLEINGNTDFAVAFDDLKVAFDQLKSQVTSNLTAISTAIGTLGGTYTVIPLTASVDSAKVPTIKVP